MCLIHLSLLDHPKLNLGDTIYYLNIKDDRDVLMLNENGDIITEKDGNKKYFELVEKLDSILDDYILTDNDGKSVSTGKKKNLYSFTYFC